MNRKLYGLIQGRCPIHGMNHIKSSGRRIPGCICEVAAECMGKSRHRWWKRFARRVARRKGWGEAVS